MPSDPKTDEAPRGRQYTYLPVLTWSLLTLMVVYFFVWFLSRPSTAERLQVASFAEALHDIPSEYLEKVDRTSLYQAAMKGMVASLKDKYSWYLTPRQLTRLSEETKGEFGGIGVVLSAAAGKPLVERVLQDSPAARAGIEPGDIIVQLDGEDIAGWPLDKVSSLVRGQPGTEVTMQLARGTDAHSVTVKVTRELIHVPDVEHEMLQDGIGVLRVLGFDETCAEDTKSALTDMLSKGLKGLVFDLRGNPGGLVKQATEVCDVFLNSGRILSLESRGRPAEPPVDAKPGALVPEAMPVVILVDSGTASAAEIVAGALQANHRATVVGTKTVGKGSVTRALHLPDESGLVLTVAHYELAGGEVIEGKGVQPDAVVGELPPPPEAMEAVEALRWHVEEAEKAKKEQLDRAIQVLKEKLAK